MQHEMKEVAAVRLELIHTEATHHPYRLPPDAVRDLSKPQVLATILDIECKQGERLSEKVVRQKIEAEFEDENNDRFGKTCFYEAAEWGCVGVLEEMKSSAGYTSQEWKTMFSTPLKKGQHQGRTPLFIAVLNGCCTVFESMNRHAGYTEAQMRGIITRVINRNTGETLLSLAARNADTAMLLSMCAAAFQDPAEFQKALVIDINPCTGKTLLFMLAAEGNKKMLDRLPSLFCCNPKEWGQVITTELREGDDRGKTPLLIAAEKGHVGAFVNMLKAAVTPQTPGIWMAAVTPVKEGPNKGKTPLFMAAEQGDVEAFMTMLPHVSQAEIHGRPLEYGASAGKTPLTVMLKKCRDNSPNGPVFRIMLEGVREKFFVGTLEKQREWAALTGGFAAAPDADEQKHDAPEVIVSPQAYILQSGSLSQYLADSREAYQKRLTLCRHLNDLAKANGVLDESVKAALHQIVREAREVPEQNPNHVAACHIAACASLALSNDAAVIELYKVALSPGKSIGKEEIEMLWLGLARAHSRNVLNAREACEAYRMAKSLGAILEAGDESNEKNMRESIPLMDRMEMGLDQGLNRVTYELSSMKQELFSFAAGLFRAPPAANANTRNGNGAAPPPPPAANANARNGNRAAPPPPP